MASQASGGLTRREGEVLALIAEGLNSREIAERLGIAYFTVRKHRTNILGKLQLTSAAQLAAYAAHRGIQPLPSDRNLPWLGPP